MLLLFVLRTPLRKTFNLISILKIANISKLFSKKLVFFNFLEKLSLRNRETTKSLESRIRDTTYKAQNIVDSQVGLDESLFPALDKVMKEMNSIKQEAIQITEKEKEDNNDKTGVQPRISLPAGSSRPTSHGVTTMVGLDDDFKELKTRLCSGSLQLEIVAHVGMGGIGKTTLAKKVYDDKSVISRFDTCCWVTVSQEYIMQSILIGLLGHDEESKKNKENLRLDLYQSLKNRRYLIVLDDMWDIEVWNDLKRVLPNDENGSRILLTTTLEQVAKHENSCAPKYVRLLDKNESWVLFCEKVFGKDFCPPELEEVGKEIVENCRGLPLALNVIGGHLSKATGTKIYWRSVEKKLSETIASENDEQCLRVLSLSYKQLPHRLKGCFLYLSIFPEDCDIEVSVLLHLWIVSGLIKQERSKSFEDIAKEYFLDLVERNLILVSELKYNGKIKSCKIHDLIRNLCVKEAKSEQLFALTNKTLYYYYHYHGFIFDTKAGPHRWLLRASYLNGLNTSEMDAFYRDLPNMVNLRYLRNDSEVDNRETFELLHKLGHLHTIHCRMSLTLNIWQMPQLRHVKINDRKFLVMPNPPTSKVEGNNSVIVLEKLQTLHIVWNLILTDEILQRIPNIKKLGPSYYKRYSFEAGDDEAIDWRDWREFGLNNLEHLHKLESIHCRFRNVPPFVLSRDITFPPSLKKLTLKGSRIPWEQMTVVGLLPNLEVLKLKYDSFVGEEWEPIEGEFLNLKTLHLDDLYYPDHWRAVAHHFPRLQHLFICEAILLQEIPIGFGEIPTLQVIALKSCKERIISSARQIEEEQYNFGNEGFRLQIT